MAAIAAALVAAAPTCGGVGNAGLVKRAGTDPWSDDGCKCEMKV